MQQAQTRITVHTHGQAFYEITGEVARRVADSGIATGIVTLFCRHTSAGLLINENAAPAVQRDLLRWLATIAPESAGYEHDSEGPDDMPAHVRSLLTGVSLSIPVADGRMTLGTWQGVYLAEHRRAPHSREIVVQIIGA
ncbi:YjbQ family protein [Erythrobacter arachoides]|uniref:YjbQ family protein n=1 Tax=Aurantiacibacter arachoides TaxID=1850444 RepID=A0A844ZZI3_9SPHN|nr:secondary thiamine-phosphate synthase enzyme YjbQ [Aurantiacibacter arachoides]MXO92336.1 YjbQ family protein [Aurantiacibacter arachoides]GGD57998.1 hypothetical protein GCM10011411_17550 [Aurantiacibacter arachoides]